ncbi:MAG: RNase H-like domain-containing protein, partial [Cohaesibacter sp.]|nr:RNase H-like domain-containing protein [Cohaesibacter sp.]
MTGDYRRFVKNFGQIAKPLTELLKSTPERRRAELVGWGDAHHQAFTELKNAFINAPILAKPDCSRAFIVDADASNDAVGAVLSQVTDGAEHPVYFHSRVLKDAERSYSVTEREALAVVVAVVKFRPYRS